MLKVKICKHCSNLSNKKIKKHTKHYGAKLKIGCLGRCRKKEADPDGTCYGFIGKKLKVCSDRKEFIKKLKKYLRKANQK